MTAAAAEVRRRRRASRSPTGRRRRTPATEGKLNIIAWAGYAEDGSTNPKVNWVTPFEKKTGCQTNVKVANTSDEMVTLMRTGQYDGVSASGNASVKLIAAGDVVPVDPKILTNWNDLSDNVKLQDYNSVNGKNYGATARLRGEPADVADEEGHAGADGLVGGLRPEQPVQGQGHRVRRPDLHRGRRALPEEHESRISRSRTRTS